MAVTTSAPSPSTQTALSLPPQRALALPLVFALGLAGFCLLEPVRQNPRVLWSFLGAAAALMVWDVLLLNLALSRGRTFMLEIALRKQHYVQACAQGAVLLYWGWYWRQVYASAHFIAAQLLFAYAFDVLLTWSRRDTYVLGFGPFPVIFSINLFLWFKPDWFYLQFLMVALGFAAKQLIYWDKDGRRTHIFNPSSFPLAVFSLALILTGASDLTWGQDIASTQFYPPHMYLMLFLIALPGQFFFGVTTMTMSAVVATYLFGLLYYAVTGIYFFYDSYIPIAVFLGMHLLFTDPSTSPRTELGRVIFGVLYGLSIVVLYEVLGKAGLPTFYDKLLPVPVLNLSIKLIDRVARANVLRRFDPSAYGRWMAPRQRHLAYLTVWGLVFAGMSVAQGVGDHHPGQWLPFWQTACHDGRRFACPYLAAVQSGFCDRGSGWACSELGILQARHELDRAGALQSMARGCELGFAPACLNATLVTTAAAGTLASAPPPPADYPIVLRGSKGPISARTPAALRALACREGWPEACALASGTGGGP
jgi:hypothetical protein